MNPDVTAYIEKLDQPWQAEICNRIRDIALKTIPDVSERLQYGKPHFLKSGKYAGVLSTTKGAKGQVSYTIFNATSLTAPDGFFEDGPPERKTIKIKNGQTVDYELLTKLIQQAAASS